MASVIYNNEKKQQIIFKKDKSTENLLKTFREKAASLQRPKPTKRDLVGWLELVYDSLPEGEFTNNQIYAFEQKFRRRYPDNLNIKAKIRQQLQILRGLGFLEHTGRALWRKL